MNSIVAQNRPDGERELKALCLAKLWSMRRISKTSVIASEFPLTKAAVRIDLAIAMRNQLFGIEIKSELDSLRRLAKQASEFSEFFDFLIVVLAGKHSDTQLELPDNVEVWRVAGPELIVEPAKNPKTQVDSLEKLLPKRRLVRLQRANENGVATAREFFFEEFRSRYQATSDSFWSKVSAKKRIDVEDLRRRICRARCFSIPLCAPQTAPVNPDHRLACRASASRITASLPAKCSSRRARVMPV